MSSAVPTPRVTIHDLPPELLSRAFVHLREPLREMATVPETRKCASPLLAAALVSKLWSALIQHELYGRLWMPRSYSDEDRAQQWLESPARLRHSVHELRLPRAGTAVAREVLEACPDLRRLSLPDDVEESWEVLRQFPYLTHLELVYPESLVDGADTSPLPFRLSHLYLWLSQGESWLSQEDPISPALLDALFTPSHPTLTSLVLEFSQHDNEGGACLVPYFPLVAPNLRHLSLLSDYLDPRIIRQLCGCTSIRSLELGELSPPQLHAVVRALPRPTIRHLVTLDDMTAEESRDALVTALNLPSLALVQHLALPRAELISLVLVDAGETSIVGTAESRSMKITYVRGAL